MIGRILKNTTAQVIGKVVGIAISLLTVGWLTRYLGSGGYGQLILITALVSLAEAGGDFGSRIVGVREVARAKHPSRVLAEIGWWRKWTYLAVMVLAMIIVWGGGWYDGVESIASLALLMLIVNWGAGIVEIKLMAEIRSDQKAIMDVLYPLLFLLTVWWWKKWGLVGVVVGYIWARIISWWWGWRQAGMRPEKVKGSWKLAEKWWRLTWPMGVYLLLFTAYDRWIDAVMIKGWIGIREVAWYGLAYKIYSNLLQPAAFLTANVFPMLGLNKQEDKKYVRWGVATLLLGAGLVAAVMYLLAPVAILILGGSGYVESVGLLRWLLAAMVFAYLNHLWGFWLIAKGRQKELLGVGGIAVVFNLTMNWWMIPRYGVVAAAWVTVMTEALSCWLLIRKQI